MADITRPAVILLVEDDRDDQELTRMALAKGRLPTDLHVAEDGIEALEFLRKEGRYAGPGGVPAPRPDLILLDLNLPRLDGREFLDALRADSRLRHLPVVVLTTSTRGSDVRACYGLGANSYMVKPNSMGQFVRAMTQLQDYWFDLVVLPDA
jgi:two-component system, chemotaxis family, response regulator Rcp1